MSHQQNISHQGQEVIEALSPLVKWKFDEFHKVMLAEFSVDKEDQVMFALKQILPFCWDAKSIKKAPSQIKHYAGPFAKLTRNQRLLSSSDSQRPPVMVAWWPWGHGATISVRLFLTNSAEFEHKPSLLQRITQIFS